MEGTIIHQVFFESCPFFLKGFFVVLGGLVSWLGFLLHAEDPQFGGANCCARRFFGQWLRFERRFSPTQLGGRRWCLPGSSLLLLEAKRPCRLRMRREGGCFSLGDSVVAFFEEQAGVPQGNQSGLSDSQELSAARSKRSPLDPSPRPICFLRETQRWVDPLLPRVRETTRETLIPSRGTSSSRM